MIKNQFKELKTSFKEGRLVKKKKKTTYFHLISKSDPRWNCKIKCDDLIKLRSLANAKETELKNKLGKVPRDIIAGYVSPNETHMVSDSYAKEKQVINAGPEIINKRGGDNIMKIKKENVEQGMKIKILRKKKGWDQYMMAKKSGLKKSTICTYERGKRAPSNKSLDYIITALGITLQDFRNLNIFKEKGEKTSVLMGRRMFFLRLMRGLSQIELANQARVSQSSVSFYERGKTEHLTKDILEPIASVLKTTIQDLMESVFQKEEPEIINKEIIKEEIDTTEEIKIPEPLKNPIVIFILVISTISLILKILLMRKK